MLRKPLMIAGDNAGSKGTLAKLLTVRRILSIAFGVAAIFHLAWVLNLPTSGAEWYETIHVTVTIALLALGFLWLPLRIVARAICIAFGGVHAWYAVHNSPGVEQYRSLLLSSAVFGTGAGLWWVRLELKKALIGSTPAAIISSFILVALASGFLVGVSFHYGHVQFGGFDHSVLIDIAWRMMHGQRPNVDFPCTVPPAFYLGASYSFGLFGPSWTSLVLLNSIYVAVTFCWLFWLLHKVLRNTVYALLLSFAVEAFSTVLTGYWWYNPICSVAAVLFVVSALALFYVPKSRSLNGSYFAALLLLALMKPNVSGPLIALVTVVLLTSKLHRSRVIILSLASFIGFVVILAINGISLTALLKGYASVSHRGFSTRAFDSGDAWDTTFVKFALALLSLPITVTLGQTWPHRKNRDRWILLAGALTGSYAFITNGEVKLTDCPIILVSGALLVLLPQTRVELDKRNRWAAYIGFVAMVLCSVSLMEAVVRTRVKAIGVFYSFELTTKIKNGFFTGLQAGPTFELCHSEVEKGLATVSARTGIPKTNLNIYFGPRLQWAYADANLQSPRGLPVWWHPGVSFDRSDESKYRNRWAHTEFDAAIFLRYDFMYMSSDFISMVTNRYETVDPNGFVWIMMPRRSK